MGGSSDRGGEEAGDSYISHSPLRSESATLTRPKESPATVWCPGDPPSLAWVQLQGHRVCGDDLASPSLPALLHLL